MNNSMSTNSGEDTLGIIENLIFLSECIDKKCQDLSNVPESADSLKRLKKYCLRTRQNCQEFKEVLLQKHNSNDSQNMGGDLVITLNLKDIIGEDNCRNLKKEQIAKFKADLEIFTKNYLLQTGDPVFLNLYQLFCCDSRTDSTETQEILRSEIVPSSKEVPNQCSSEKKDDLNLKNKDENKLPSSSSHGVVHEEDISSTDLQNESVSLNKSNVENDSEEQLNDKTSDSSEKINTCENLQASSISSTEISSNEEIPSQNSEIESSDSTELNLLKQIEDEITECVQELSKETEIEEPNITESQPESTSVNFDSDATIIDSTTPNVDTAREVNEDLPTSTDEIFDVPNSEKSSDENDSETLVIVEENFDGSDSERVSKIVEETTLPSTSTDRNVAQRPSSRISDSFPGTSNPEGKSSANQSCSPDMSWNVQSSDILTAESSNTDNLECLDKKEDQIRAEAGPSTQSTIVSLDSEELNDDTAKDVATAQKGENSNKQQLFLTELGLSQIANYEKSRTMRDELLDIFAEVNCKEDENGVMREVGNDVSDSSSDSSDDEEKYSASKVAAALKELEEDDVSDVGMISDYELDSSSVDDLLHCEISDAEEDSQEGPETVTDFISKKCSVVLDRRNLEKLRQEIQSTPELLTTMEKSIDDEHSQSESDASKDVDSARKSEDEDAEIDRLCKLSTLEKKRKLNRDEEKISKRKVKRKRRSINLSGTETSDLSGYSSVSDNEVNRENLSRPEEDDKDEVPLDPNALLVEIVCHTIHDSDSDSSAIFSDDEVKKSRRKKVDKIKTEEEEEIKIKKEKEETWKDDPLLRGNLNLPSEKAKDKKIRKRQYSSNSDLEREPKRKRNTNKQKYLDPDYSESSSTDSSDDSEDDFRPVKKEKKNFNDDSDIEIVNSTTNKIISVDSEEEFDDKNVSRKKIKSVLSTKSLTEETQRAAEEEKARVKKLEEQKQLRNSQESQCTQDDSWILDTSPDGSTIVVDPNLSKKLFSHQKEGVKFMWDSCYLSIDSLKTFQGTGCILAHNMGLGKTFQVVTLVHTLFNHPATNTKNVLIVCPLSTLSGWRREFHNALKLVKTTKNINISSIESKDDRGMKCYMIKRWNRDGGVLIIGYDAFSRLTRDSDSNELQDVKKALVDPGPDLVVCDEAHVLKNGKALRTKALMKIKTKRRIALTGTPLQNNLNEYYFMVQFVKPNLLGNKQEFRRQFCTPIMNGQFEDSREYDITLMKKRTHVLHRLLKNTVQRYEATELNKHLMGMQDYTLFIQLHPLQEQLYKKYLELKKINKKNIKKFFVDYQILKYICSHPQLLHTMETQNVQHNKSDIQEKEVISEEPEIHEFEGLPQNWWKSHCTDDIKTSLEFGTKLQVMMGIIEEAEKIGEKVLIFTSSLVELSSVEYFLKLRGTPSCPSWKSKKDYFRMDGTVPPSIRTEMCDMFNDKRNKSLRVFLMSHKVGGLGLNLTSANRVILLGANFNPSHDTQSIYRVYRFGQTKMVYIYRLLSMGTMEEKIYNRCVTKLAIASRVVDKHQITRHYKNLDLEDLYKTEIDLTLQRNLPAKPDDDILSSLLLRFECIHKFHHHQKLLENRPDEDLNEEDQRKAWEEFEDMKEREKNAARNTPAPKISEIVQNQWNQLHKLPPPLVPLNNAALPLPWPNGLISELINVPITSNVNGMNNKLTATNPQKTSNIIGTPTQAELGNIAGTSNQTRIGNIASSISRTDIGNVSDIANQAKTGIIAGTSNQVKIGNVAGNVNKEKASNIGNISSQAQTGNVVGSSKQAKVSAIGQAKIGKFWGTHMQAKIGNISGPIDLSKTGTIGKTKTGNQAKGISDAGKTAILNSMTEILKNVSNSTPAGGSHKSLKKKSTAIGPNPLYQHRKENVLSNSTRTPWRTSSSDDFQRPSSSSLNKKTKSKVPVQVAEGSTDEDVVCIDDISPVVQAQLDELRKRNLTIWTTPSKEKDKGDPPIIDIT